MGSCAPRCSGAAPAPGEVEQRRIVEEDRILRTGTLSQVAGRGPSLWRSKLVGIRRAFVSKPRLLLLDEPSAGLNRQEKENLARFLMRGRHEFGPTIVWIEHDMQLVRDLADKVFVMHYGKELAYGSPEEVLSNPQVIEAYIGSRARKVTDLRAAREVT